MTYPPPPLGLRRFAALAPLLIALALAGCGRSEKERMDAARAFFDKRDIASAMIELKNVLQADPESGEARFLLGKALFLGGDALGAEAEMRRALVMRHPPDQVVPQLATVMVALQRFAALIKEFGSTQLGDAGAAADLMTQLAVAHMALGALDEAEAQLKGALQRVGGHRAALEVQARLRAARGDAHAAFAIVDGLLAGKADDTAALVLRAEVLLQGGPEARGAAAEAYRKAIALDAKLVQAHGGLIAMHLSTRDLEAAHKQWQQLSAAQPRHPLTRFYEAVLALQRGEPQKTREIAQHLIRNAPDNPRLQMLAGLAEQASGSLLQAETHLSKAVLLAPDAPQPRRVLAQAYLEFGQPRRALEQLGPLARTGSQDVEAITLVGRAHLMAGDTAAAEAAFARAALISPADPGLRTGMALAQIGKGQTEAGLAALEAAAGRDNATDGDLALINARLQRKQYPAALAAIDRLARKSLGSPVPDLLRGRIASAQGQHAQARASWEAALEKSAQYLPALSALAELDIAQGNAGAARARIAAASKREPGNAALLLALADLTGRTGGSKADVVALLRQAVRAAPADTEPHVRLIDYALALSDLGLALGEAQSATSAIPEHAALLDRLGLVQQRMGDLQQAATTFGRLASVQPRSAAPHLRLADVNLALGRAETAVQQTRRALQLDPDSMLGHRAAAFAALRAGSTGDALALARAAQERWPAPGLQLEGELEMASRNTEGGLAALRKAFAASPGHIEAAIQLHLALLSAAKSKEAGAHAQAWLARHPNDSTFALHLGNLAAGQDDFARAESHYQQIVKREPNHIQALNNLAHALAAQKKSGAVELARRALKLAPNQPALMDTLAFSQAASGQVAEALALQKTVVEMSPDEPEFRLSLARLLIQSGEKEPAREILNQLAKRGAAYPRQAEVGRLLEKSRK